MPELNNEIIQVDDMLTLEQLRIEDADRLFALTDKDREYLSEFLPWPKFTKTVSDSRGFIELMLQRRKDNKEYGYGIKYDGSVIGHISLMHIAEERPEIGYWIASEYNGRGITSKASAALTHFALSTMEIPRLVIRAEPENIGSNKIAEKIGYTLVGQEHEDGKTLNIWSIGS